MHVRDPRVRVGSKSHLECAQTSDEVVNMETCPITSLEMELSGWLSSC
jgi:hypothetical protein